MPIFVLMTKLAPEAMEDAQIFRRKGKDWLDKVKACCPDVKWISHYALLGRYDFMDVYEAPDVQTAHMVSMISRSHGALSAESWQALPYEEYANLLGKVTTT
jgi:uncharacterized protein with GYD domain